MQPQRAGPFPYVPINRRPTITWPNGARLALWVIPNVETFPLNEPVPGGTGPAPEGLAFVRPAGELAHARLPRRGRRHLRRRLDQRRPALSNERRGPAPVLDPVLRGDQRSAADPPRRPVVGRVRAHDPPPVRHALPRGGAVGTRDGDLPTSIHHRCAAPDRGARIGRRL